ncbi:MAG: YafY family transcriptional regulator [Magnetospirillum sp.]|nr:YafY family transcriptional regulator [Magnetospirillum sp.]
MRRADRLFQIIQALRGGRLTTARQLAERLEVSERTIYRDIRDLKTSGVPVDGEAGVGYLLRDGFDIPPLMFDRGELEALVVGARMVEAWGGTAQASAATEALKKIEAVVPAALRDRMERSRIFALGFHQSADLRNILDGITRAIDEKRVLSFDYVREDGESSSRTCRPLGLYFWGKVWTLAAWCELRDDFRHFRADRIARLEVGERRFREEPGRTLEDFLKTVRSQQTTRN